MKKVQVNLFLTRAFISTVGVVVTTYIKPAIEDFVKSDFLFSTERHGLPVLYATATLTYLAWLRHASDYEGVSYTPHKTLGRDKEKDDDIIP
jgi:hypothetical protein